MCKKIHFLILVFYTLQLNSQTKPTDATVFSKNAPPSDTMVKAQENQLGSNANLLTYMRVISDPKSAMRIDENMVTNFNLVNWLRLELGLRYGQRPEKFNSYYQYKIELRTKTIWKTTQFFTRITDNVISFPKPAYKRTYTLFVAETKVPLAKSFHGILALGYLFSFQQSNDINAFPATKGIQTNHAIFKLALRYLLKNNGFVELVYGSYDVFDPYELNKPFAQISWEYDLNASYALYAFTRYQYNNTLFNAYNYFLGLGIRFHLLKK